MVPFHQGEAVEPDGTPAPSCIPTITGDTIPTGLCFQKLRDGEFLKGREYQTRVRASAGGTLLQETLQAFSVSFLGYGSTPLAGL